MARWTSSIDDILKIRLVAWQIPLDGIARIVLLDDTIVEGVIREVHVGNSGGHGGWQYYGECQIETRKKKLRSVDYLDVRSASSIWSKETAAEYERLGLLVNVQRT